MPSLLRGLVAVAAGVRGFDRTHRPQPPGRVTLRRSEPAELIVAQPDRKLLADPDQLSDHGERNLVASLGFHDGSPPLIAQQFHRIQPTGSRGFEPRASGTKARRSAR